MGMEFPPPWGSRVRVRGNETDGIACRRAAFPAWRAIMRNAVAKIRTRYTWDPNATRGSSLHTSNSWGSPESNPRG